jgi:predicted O-linked N-acetylglucosamine transferase (SPINDLY family)
MGDAEMTVPTWAERVQDSLATRGAAVAIETLALAHGARARPDDLAAAAARLLPALPVAPPAALVGFDRPASVHIVGRHALDRPVWSLVEAAIRARPGERHVVLLPDTPAAQVEPLYAHFAGLGAFAVAADPEATLMARWTWLAGRLAALCPRRVVVALDDGAVLPHLAALVLAGRMGRRLYCLWPVDPAGIPAAGLHGACHLAAGEGSARALEREGLRPIRLPLHLPRQARAPLPERVARALVRKGAAGRAPTPLRPLPEPPRITATIGADDAFGAEGGAGLAALAARVVATTRGTHHHLGGVSAGFVLQARTAFARAGCDPSRLVFHGAVPALAPALQALGVQLVLAGARRPRAEEILAVSGGGIPLAFAAADLPADDLLPPDSATWDDGVALADLLSTPVDPDDRLDHAHLLRDWAEGVEDGALLVRRLDLALLAVEGRRPGRPDDPAAGDEALRSLFDVAHYARNNTDVVAAGADLFAHFRDYGEAEGRDPCRLFDPAWYLAQVPEAEREGARRHPLRHYALRGEALGLQPNALFDPGLARRAMDAAGVPPAEGAVPTELARYLDHKPRVATHTFFDGAHYARSLPALPQDETLLGHFLSVGVEEGVEPHPLVRLPRLFIGEGGYLRGLVDWIARPCAPSAERSPHPLVEPVQLLAHGEVRYRAAAPNTLWAHLIEGNQPDRSTHPFVWPRFVEGRRPGTLAGESLLPALAANRLGADTHPLVSAAHLTRQAPWLATERLSPTQYFAELAVAHNLDPHPWFSTQYYLYHSADVARTGLNPLAHYLAFGEREGRRPHAFFDPAHYYAAHRGATPLAATPLSDYVRSGAAYFRRTWPMDEGLQRLTLKTAQGLLEEAGAPTAGPGGTQGHTRAASLLADAIHPDTAPPHPTLVTEARPLLTGFPAGMTTTVLHPAVEVVVLRPPVAAPTHIAPASGRVSVPAAERALVRDALVVPGNDGFALADTGAGADRLPGAWLDPAMLGFDPDVADLRQNGALVAMAADMALLRRHGPEEPIAEGIFACGTYSRNYFHFLHEVLPRALLAAEGAPDGVPVLTDDDMPVQHYQALALFLPDRPVLRLARQRSYRVDRLHAASMPNLHHDAFGSEVVPVSQLRFHPEVVRRVAALARAFDGAEGPERVFLWREASVRRLENQADLAARLAERGFATVNMGELSFAEQLRHMAAARVVVGQSGAHLANIAFCRPGTQVYALFSNAPGTNYGLWSRLGAAVGVSVTNMAGWRIVHSVGGNTPAAHDHFTVQPDTLLPFFPAPLSPLPPAPEEDDEAAAERAADVAWQALGALHAAAAEADALTSAWSVSAGPTPAGFDDRLIALRQRAHDAILAVPDGRLAALLGHPFMTEAWARVKSAFPLLGAPSAAEARTIETLGAALTALSMGDEPEVDADAPARDPRVGPGDAWHDAPFRPEAEEGTDEPAAREGIRVPAGRAADLRRLLLLAHLEWPLWQLPLPHDLGALPRDVADHWLSAVALPPYLFREGEDEAYVERVAHLLDWIADRMEGETDGRLRLRLARVAGGLDLGALFLVDAPLTRVFAARNRVLARIAVAEGQPRAALRPADGREGRIRVGILCRTFDKGPDSEAVVAFCKGLDPARYELYAYSVGFRDRVVSADSSFARAFDAAIPNRRLLPSDAAGIRAALVGDGLDVFLYANATTYGLRPLDLALYHRVAPVQAVLNCHVPQSLGYPSFDAYITGLSDDPEAEVPQADHPERLIRLPGPVIGYLNTLKPRARPALDRAGLGLDDDDVVLMNAGSMSKLRHDCLSTMMRAVMAVERGVLLLAPYNPGWAARSQAFSFNRQLAETAAEVGLDPARIRVLGELSVAEAEAALSLADIYLNPFPHGGATMTHLALIYGVPPVTMRRRSTRSIDQFLVASLGFPELLVSSAAEYVALAARLGADAEGRRALQARLRAAGKAPPFVDDPGYSAAMAAGIDDLVAGARAAGPAGPA